MKNDPLDINSCTPAACCSAHPSDASRAFRAIVALVGLSCAALSQSAQAQGVLTWTAGSGTWDTTAQNWTGPSAWTQGNATTPTTGALFNGAGGTVTLGESVAATSLEFNSSGYVIQEPNPSGPGMGLYLGGGSTPTLTVANGITANIYSPLAGTQGFIKNGGGTLTLNHYQELAPTITGNVTINAGTLYLEGFYPNNRYASNTFIAAGASIVFDTVYTINQAVGNFEFTGTGNVIKKGTGTWEVGPGGGKLEFNLSAGALIDIQEGKIQCNNIRNSFTNNQASINVAAGATMDFFAENVQLDALTGLGTVRNGYAFGGHDITIGVAGGSGTFAGVIENGSATPVNVIKSGSGIQTFSGNNTYTGITTVSAGTLLINGNQSSATGAVSVATGATLGGNGTIGGNTTISGNLRPGNSPGLLTFNGTLTLNGTSTTTMEIDGTTRATLYDGVDVASSLTYGGNLTLAIGTTFSTGNYTFNLFDFASQSGDFATGGVTLTGNYSGILVNDGFGVWGLTSGDNTWTFSQATGDLGLTVVPEPATWILAAFGLTTAVVLRRRRHT